MADISNFDDISKLQTYEDYIANNITEWEAESIARVCRKIGKIGKMSKKELEKQIPKKPYKDNENGIYETEHCPTCHRSLFPNDHHCRCGQEIDWGDTE